MRWRRVIAETSGEPDRGDTVGERRAEPADVLPFPSARPSDAEATPGTDTPRLRDLIGDVLRDERLDQQRTLDDVAREAAVSLPYLSEVGRGRKEISSDLLAAICEALELPLADVLQQVRDHLRSSGVGRSGAQMLAD